MKIRNGFVSNSSSSSFVIISKNGKLTKEKIMKAFDVNEKSPLYRMAQSLAGEIISSCQEQTKEQCKNNYLGSIYSDDDFKEEYPDIYEIYTKSEKLGWKVYEGSADSCDQPTLCDLELEYEDDDIKISKDGVY